jgi:hypothetical protein
VSIYLENDIRSMIQENEEIRQDGLRDDSRRLRPDMMFERRSRSQRNRRGRRRRDEDDREAQRDQGEVADVANELKVMEILGFSCPYGYISHGRDSLERTYEEKKRKYAELKNLRREQVRVTAVIVSSMGARYGPSLTDLQKVLRCNDKEM